MKLRFIAAAFGTAATAAAIAAAPGATADDGGSSPTMNQRPGHVSIQVSPPIVSEPRIYGEFPTAASILD